jgi:peptidoglycan hydrolase-like protein with peptidoglycan-binding domain
MRYTDFKIVETKLREAGEVYVIGDSHAKAMGGTNNLASDGANLDAIATQANNVPNGATVYMTGGHNDVPAGTNPQQIANQVKSIISTLEGKGCTVNYVLFPEGSSNTKQDQMGPTRQAITTAVTVGKDLEGCSLSDGIHCQMSSYAGIVNASATSNTNPNDPIGNKMDRDNAATLGLEAGPPYPQEQVDDVKALQTRLEELGYSVGNTGIDGKYGPRTERAVAAFKRDNNVTPATGDSVNPAASATLATATKVENPTPTGNNSRYSGEPLGDLADVANLAQAKEVVEEFLGSTISDNDMNMLVRATASEASRHNLERAAVAAVILNRVRLNHNNYGASIPAQLEAHNQFQAVTGTKANGRQASDGYTNMTTRTAGEVIGTIIKNLPSQNNTWRNFTSNIPSAYGPGTDIGFMYAMRNSPGARIIGKTVFGTA